MPQILTEDYENLRIYLHPDTVVLGFDPAALQREHRRRRRLNVNDERNYPPMVFFRGNENKGGGKFTPRITNLRSGVRIVPYEAAHNLKIKNEIVCIEDQVSNQACFDRLTVLSNVDIDVDYNPIEIVSVNSGSGVTEQDKIDIANLINPNITSSQNNIRGDIANLNDLSLQEVVSEVVGRGMSDAQATMLLQLWQLRGFDINVSPIIEDGRYVVGNAVVVIDNSNPQQTILRRQ